MVRLVLRLSPVAKIGALIAVVGVGLGVYGRLGEAAWAVRASIPVVAVGAVMYYASRFRSFRKKRKLDS